jgi:uroporphyrinogen decarboxylase
MEVSKKDRLQAAIEKSVADRPPVALWRHFPVDDQKPEDLANSIAEFQRSYDFDFVKITPASSYCLSDWGVEDQWQGNGEGTRTYTKRVIQALEDWRQLTVLDPRKGELSNQLRCIELLRADLGPDLPMITTIFSPLAQAKNLAGESLLFEHLRRDPERVQAGLRVITESTVGFIEAAKELNIDGIFYAVQHGSYRYFDRDSYAHMVEWSDRMIWDAASPFWLNVLHLHGEAIFFDLAEKLPAAVTNWHDKEVQPSLSEGAQRVRGAVCGGVRRETLALGIPDEVRVESNEALSAMDGGGVVLGTGCVTPIITPRSNLLALRNAVEPH